NAREKPLPPGERGTRENTLDDGKRGGMERSERGRVQNLRNAQDPQAVHGPGDGREARGRAQEAEDEHCREAKAAKDGREQRKDEDFGHHADRPEGADGAARIACLLQVQREEGVERAVGGRHADPGGKEGRHAGRKRDSPGARRLAFDAWRSLAGRKERRASEREEREEGERPGRIRGGAALEPEASAQHYCNESYGAPEPDGTVAPGRGDGAERARLDERQRARREDAAEAHEQRDERHALGEREQNEAGRHRCAGEDDDAAVRARPVGERAPGGRGGDARELRQSEDQRDVGRAEAAARQVRGEVGDVGRGKREEREVERRQPSLERRQAHARFGAAPTKRTAPSTSRTKRAASVPSRVACRKWPSSSRCASPWTSDQAAAAAAAGSPMSPRSRNAWRSASYAWREAVASAGSEASGTSPPNISRKRCGWASANAT